MSERIEGLIEKTEKTIEGIVYAFGAYFRTLAALAFPFFLVRTFFLRLHRLRKRNLLAPPLVFLSISAFVFSIALAIIDTSKFIDPEAVVGGLKARANINISITELLFSIFPIFLWVWLLAWTGRLLVVHANRRKQVSRYFCYIFGFFSAAFFLWFLAWALMVSHYVQPRNIGQEHRGLPLLVGLLLTFLMWVIFHSFSLSVITIWRLTRSEAVLKRIFKSALGLVLLAAMIIGSFFIQSIPRRLNEAIAKPADPAKETSIKLVNWPQGPNYVPDIEFDGTDHIFIKIRIIAANPRDTTAFLDRKMTLHLFANEIEPIDDFDLYVNESTQSTDPVTLLAKDSRLINYQVQLERSRYQKIAGRTLRFAIEAQWYDLTKDGLERHIEKIVDDRGYNLYFYFKSLTGPKPPVEKSKKNL